MAENKKVFTAYCDWGETFKALPDDKAGQLVKHLFDYVNDENPETDDVLINAVFANIKNTLKRDLKKWEEKVEKNRENARKRWDATASDGTKRNANDADKDKERDKDKDKEKVRLPIRTYKREFDDFWIKYDKKVDKKKCHDVFRKLKESEIQLILEHVPKYVKANKDSKYRKNPLTYLRGECWNDEIEEQEPKETLFDPYAKHKRLKANG